MKQKPSRFKDPIEAEEKPDLDIFELDKTTLDKHWLEQPNLVARYCMEMADARDALERARARLDLTKAEAENEITKNPEKFGLEKTTVSSIASAVIKHPDVLSATERVHKRSHRVGVLQAMLTALEHRKRSLEGLVDLLGKDYFSVPKASQEGVDALAEQTKRNVRRGRDRKED